MDTGFSEEGLQRRLRTGSVHQASRLARILWPASPWRKLRLAYSFVGDPGLTQGGESSGQGVWDPAEKAHHFCPDEGSCNAHRRNESRRIQDLDVRDHAGF